MTGRKVGEDIVQECTLEDGSLSQWIFTDIAQDSFRWLGRSSTNGGKSWTVSGEFHLHRRRGLDFNPHQLADPPHDFDFWIGSWQVHDPSTGELTGHSKVETILDGRALRERWSSGDGVSGESLNIYDSGRGVWHQTWVDSSGQLLVIEGTFDDEAMELHGRDVAGTRHRIRWTQPSAESVLQEVEVSCDEGTTGRACSPACTRQLSTARRTRRRRCRRPANERLAARPLRVISSVAGGPYRQTVGAACGCVA
jgi:hypothetical protein